MASKPVDLNADRRDLLPKIAPEGMEYLCGACGRRSLDRYVGDTSCMTWYVLVWEGTNNAVQLEELEKSRPRV